MNHHTALCRCVHNALQERVKQTLTYWLGDSNLSSISLYGSKSEYKKGIPKNTARKRRRYVRNYKDDVLVTELLGW